MDPVPEIRREKVFLEPGMSTAEVMKTYGLSSDQAYKARVKGFFVKNYSKSRSSLTGRNSIKLSVTPWPRRSLGRISVGTLCERGERGQVCS